MQLLVLQRQGCTQNTAMQGQEDTGAMTPEQAAEHVAKRTSHRGVAVLKALLGALRKLSTLRKQWAQMQGLCAPRPCMPLLAMFNQAGMALHRGSAVA